MYKVVIFREFREKTTIDATTDQKSEAALASSGKIVYYYFICINYLPYIDSFPCLTCLDFKIDDIH